MYPSDKDVLFGVFVKNFKERLEEEGAFFEKIIVIKGKTSNSGIKLLRYLNYYLKGLIHGVFSTSDFVYIHFLAHNIPLIMIIKLFSRRTIVVNIHGSDIIKYKDHKLLKKLSAISLKNCERIVVPSMYFSKVIQESFNDIDKKKIIVYPSGGINRSVFCDNSTTVIPREKKSIILGMTSRIDENKGWDVFLQAVKKLVLEEYTISGIIIGQGTQEKELLGLKERLGLSSIEYLGLLPQKEIAELYKNIDLFIFPTLLNESLGLVGLEAMSCGLPVIASNVGAPSSYVKDGKNGYVFEANNSDMLAAKIKEFMNLNQENKNKMREQAIKTAKEYDSTCVTSNLFRELKNIC